MWRCKLGPTVEVVCTLGQLFNRLVLQVMHKFSWWEPVNLDIKYRNVCSTEKSSEILSYNTEKKAHNNSKAILKRKIGDNTI